MLQEYVSSISDISEVCCNLFHVDVVKIDRDISYVALVVYVCYKLFCSQYLICFCRRMLQVRLSICCIRFTHMLQVFYLNAAYILQWFSSVFRCFASVSDACFMCFICLKMYVAKCCIWMFQK